jgi:hypothetical protein
MDYCKHATLFSSWTTINARIRKFTFLFVKFEFLNADFDMIDSVSLKKLHIPGSVPRLKTVHVVGS